MRLRRVHPCWLHLPRATKAFCELYRRSPHANQCPFLNVCEAVALPAICQNQCSKRPSALEQRFPDGRHYAIQKPGWVTPISRRGSDGFKIRPTGPSGVSLPDRLAGGTQAPYSVSTSALLLRSSTDFCSFSTCSCRENTICKSIRFISQSLTSGILASIGPVSSGG